MDKEQVIGELLENSSHGTRREDIEAAYSAGVTAGRELCAKLCESLYPELRDGKEVQLPCFDGGEVCAAAIRGA